MQIVNSRTKSYSVLSNKARKEDKWKKEYRSKIQNKCTMVHKFNDINDYFECKYVNISEIISKHNHYLIISIQHCTRCRAIRQEIADWKEKSKNCLHFYVFIYHSMINEFSEKMAKNRNPPSVKEHCLSNSTLQ